MATSEQVQKLLLPLVLAYPRVELSKETILLYSKYFSDYPDKVLELAVKQIIAESVFFPSIAELRKMCDKIQNASATTPTAFEAWSEVQGAIQKFGYLREPTFSSPEVEKAVRMMGWQNLCLSETQMVDRAHFFRIYESIITNDTERRRMLGEVREFIGLGYVGRKELPE